MLQKGFGGGSAGLTMLIALCLALGGGASGASAQTVPSAPPAAAQAADLFTVHGIAVDATAKSATEAREAALADAHVKAFRKVLEKLTPRSQAAMLPKLPNAQIANMVQTFQVEQEKSSAVHYVASYSFRFRADDIRSLLRRSGIAFAETMSKPLVVVPVLRGRSGSAALWEESNAWRAAWSRLPGNDGLVPLVVPGGELGDLGAVNAEAALAGDRTRLGNLAQLHATTDTLVTAARMVDGGKRAVVEVTSTRYSLIGAEPATTDTYAAEANENPDALLMRAARSVADGIEERWKQSNQLQAGQEQTLAAEVPLRGIEDWITVRRNLAGVVLVRRSDVASLSQRSARINLAYGGDLDQLRRALAQKDLVLTQEATGWVLRLAAAGGQ